MFDVLKHESQYNTVGMSIIASARNCSAISLETDSTFVHSSEYSQL